MNNNLVVSNLFTAAPRQLVLAKDKLSKRKQNDNIDTFQKMISTNRYIAILQKLNAFKNLLQILSHY